MRRRRKRSCRLSLVSKPQRCPKSSLPKAFFEQSQSISSVITRSVSINFLPALILIGYSGSPSHRKENLSQHTGGDAAEDKEKRAAIAVSCQEIHRERVCDVHAGAEGEHHGESTLLRFLRLRTHIHFTTLRMLPVQSASLKISSHRPTLTRVIWG